MAVEFTETDMANLIALADCAIDRDIHLIDGFVPEEIDVVREKIRQWKKENE